MKHVEQSLAKNNLYPEDERRKKTNFDEKAGNIKE